MHSFRKMHNFAYMNRGKQVSKSNVVQTEHQISDRHDTKVQLLYKILILIIVSFPFACKFLAFVNLSA